MKQCQLLNGQHDMIVNSVSTLVVFCQGGLDYDKRRDCAAQLVKREVTGFAIGGLSGGEEKDVFWRIVKVTAEALPEDKPR